MDSRSNVKKKDKIDFFKMHHFDIEQPSFFMIFLLSPKMNNTNDKIPLKENIVKEGWMWKKGQHLRNWRLRYFILLDNGQLLGFKKIPNERTIETPLNCFDVNNSEISEIDSVKQFEFILKCFHGDSQIQRQFALSNTYERTEWIRAIKKVNLNDSLSIAGDRKVAPQDFEYIQVLGRGTFGKVMLCREKSSEKLFAIKVIKKESISTRRHLSRTLTENRILKCINHPFLTSLKYSFQTTDHLCFVMDYVNGGELFFHLKKFNRFAEERARFYAGEIVLALSYLHALDIVYRDIKSENILLDKNGHIKLVDFGLCREDLPYEKKSNSFCGTPEYMAPEVIRRNVYGKEVDWWSTGVILYEMLCGALPFYHNNYNNLFSLILSRHPKIPDYVSSEANDLIKGLLQKNPKRRLGFGSADSEDIKRHPFFKTINWYDLEDRKITPPFIPNIQAEDDTRYFDLVVACESTSFTPPVHSPLTKYEDEIMFKRFSFQDDRH